MRVALDTTNILGRARSRTPTICWPTGSSSCCGRWRRWSKLRSGPGAAQRRESLGIGGHLGPGDAALSHRGPVVRWEWAQARCGGYERYLGSSVKGEAAIDWADRQARTALLAGIVADADRLLELSRQAQGELAEDSAGRQQIVAGANPDPHPARIGLTDQIPLPNKGFPSGFLVGVKEFNERKDHG